MANFKNIAISVSVYLAYSWEVTLCFLLSCDSLSACSILPYIHLNIGGVIYNTDKIVNVSCLYRH